MTRTGFDLKFNGKDFVKKVLLNTKLFIRPENDLAKIFDLKTSGKEAFLFASYANTGYSNIAYLYDDELIIQATEEVSYPLCPFLAMDIRDFCTYRFVKNPSIATFLDLNGDLTKKLLEKEKYIKILEKPYYSDYGYLRSSTLRHREKEFQGMVKEVLKMCKESNIEPSNVLIYVLTAGENGSIYYPDESFYEYLAGVVFREKGYLVSRINFSRYPMGPDFFAFRPSDLSRGAFWLEICLKLTEINQPQSEEGSTVIIEAEDTPNETRSYGEKAGVGQALKYLGPGYFDKAFVIGPLAQDLCETEKRAGIITFDEKGKIYFKDGKSNAVPELQNETLREVNAWIKLALSR